MCKVAKQECTSEESAPAWRRRQRPSSPHPFLQQHLLNARCSGAGRGWPKDKQGFCHGVLTDVGDSRQSLSVHGGSGRKEEGNQV